MKGKKDGENIAPATISAGETPRKGKIHPPLPKPRPPTPPPEPETPKKPVDLECSSDEDESSRRRAPPRQSKKQKRAQKSHEVREDRAVLNAMTNPIPSGSGPLLREQEKIKKMYPKKFLPMEYARSSVPSKTLEEAKVEKEEETKVSKSVGAMRKGVKVPINRKSVKDEGSAAHSPRPIRSSLRQMKRNADDGSDHQDSEVQGKAAKSPKHVESHVEIENESCANNDIQPSPAKSAKSGSGSSDSPVPAVVDLPMPKPNQRPRRLPKRLMSPEVGEIPPVLFRISSRGSLNNLTDQDEGPPVLKPMSTSTPSPVSKKPIGKENQIVTRKNAQSTSRRSTPMPQDCDSESDKEQTGEPARKKVARSRRSSAASTPVVVKPQKVSEIPSKEEEPKSQRITRTSSLRSKTKSSR